MPLYIRRRPGTSILWLDGTIEGRRVRESTGTDNPDLAEIKRAAREAELFKAAVAGVRPTVPFARAAREYLKANRPGLTQRVVVDRLIEVLGTVPARDLSQIHADRARDALCGPDVSAATIVRNVVSPLTVILRHAARRGWCEWPHLEWPKVVRGRFNYLLPTQAEALVRHAAPHLQPLILFALCTGVRMGEALSLDWAQVDLGAARVLLWEGATKTNARRVVALNPRAIATLAALPGREGRVFRRDDGEPYDYREGSRGNIRTSWRAACARAGLPGQERTAKSRGRGRRFDAEHTPHDCRHSYATWHYAIHRDLLLLAQDVGWRSTKMAERYAHVMPSGHRAAICTFWGIRDPAEAQGKARAAR